MVRGLRGFIAIGLSAAGLALLGPGTALAGTQDQQQAQHDGGMLGTANDLQSLAQTFTAGISGKLDRVDLYLSKSGNPGPLTVEIRNTLSGAPGTTVLASTSVPASAVAVAAGSIPITFAAPATVAAGTRYAIVASNTTTGVPHTYSWLYSLATDSYTAGAPFTAIAPASTAWTASPGGDFTFTTYVVPSASAPSTSAGPTGQRAAALKKCKKKHSHKKRKKCKKRAQKLPV
ncbi:MAG: hypothetical protein QOD60_1721 [Solirubrobacterales bacterium]|nr:hypothetical protein [Solirubrobacterales bacterium]